MVRRNAPIDRFTERPRTIERMAPQVSAGFGRIVDRHNLKRAAAAVKHGKFCPAFYALNKLRQRRSQLFGIDGDIHGVSQRLT